jgi:GntR family transcriptional regulator
MLVLISGTYQGPAMNSKIDEVANTIRGWILQGRLVVGQRLPSERELEVLLGVSRTTVRAALERLQADNLISIIPRGGAFVKAPAEKILIGPSGPDEVSTPTPKLRGLELKRAGSFIRAMERLGKKVDVHFLEPSSLIRIDKELAQKGLPEGDLFLRRFRRHIIDGVPYRILDSYYLASLLGDLLHQDEGYTPLFKWLREHTGQRAAHAFERLQCRLPSEEEAQLLNISRSQPIVDMDRWVWTDQEVLFEYSRIIANASLHEYSYEYDIEEEASL